NQHGEGGVVLEMGVLVTKGLKACLGGGVWYCYFCLGGEIGLKVIRPKVLPGCEDYGA
ncbi:hypothetical protein AVEN_58148-1, partial [Araneus ventricosus]